MFNFKNNKSAFDDFTKELNNLEDKVKELDGSKIDFDILFNTEFMKQHTNVSTFDEFLIQGNFHVETEEDFEAIPDKDFDIYVATKTDFSSWEDMLDTAMSVYLDQQLDF